MPSVLVLPQRSAIDPYADEVFDPKGLVAHSRSVADPARKACVPLRIHVCRISISFDEVDQLAEGHAPYVGVTKAQRTEGESEQILPVSPSILTRQFFGS